MKSLQATIYLSASSRISFLFYGLVIICLTSATVFASNGSNETDYHALLSFKSKITHDPYKVLTSWNHSFHFCEWSGISCGNKRVTVLQLDSQGLEGSLSPYVGNLSFLRKLGLWNNSLQGTIPHELGRLSRLRILYIYDNKFSGVIPTNLSGCSNLEELRLYQNKLAGSIPEEMSLLSKLTRLVIHDNKLTGGIPPSLGNNTSMERFSATGNPLGGSIPDTLGSIHSWSEMQSAFLDEFYSISKTVAIRNKIKSFRQIPGEQFHKAFSRLKELDGAIIPTSVRRMMTITIAIMIPNNKTMVTYQGQNKLAGSIPKEMSLLSKLTILVIENNRLTGGIPPFLGNITSMEMFSANRNPLGGSIPDTLGLWKSLTAFACGGCNLYGSIPHSIFNLSLLVNLSLAESHLTGSLPSEIGNQLPNLERLQLRTNELTGVLPPSLSNCSKLRHLEMSENNFSGKLTIDFSKLREMNNILLNYNNFHGRGEADDMRFVNSLKNCTRLVYLDLNNCSLIGVLPVSIGNLSDQLSFLSLQDNRLFGSLPSSIGPIPNAIGNLSLLTQLYLDYNKLEGHIPSSFWNCKELNGLGLRYNRLAGKIPEQLLQLPSLTHFLDLSYNTLSGSIPSQIKDLKMLSYLDLSYNNLSGNITSSLGECISLTELYLSGNIFHGIIPFSLSSLRGLAVLDISQNNLSGKIPQFFDKGFSLMFLNLSFNDFDGEVPVVGVFANASLFSVLGNNKLCGGLATLELPKCKETGSKKKRFPFFVLLILIALMLLVVLYCVRLFCKKKHNSQPSQSSRNERFLKVSYNELLKATDGFSTANLIGEGGFSSVYKGILDSDGDRFVAVKVLHLLNRGALKSFLAECEAWRNIRHRNLLKIVTSCSSVDFQGNDFKAIVYEFMPNGSVHDWLHSISANTSKLNLLQRIHILRDVATALDYLHIRCQTMIVHGDLKPSNILLDDDMVAHVGDFGLARLLGTDLNQNSSTGVKGTIGYAPPEYGIGSEMTSSGDVYSFGILLLEAMTGKKPTDNMFKEGLSLHKFAYVALPDHVFDVIDGLIPSLLDEVESNCNKEQFRSLLNKRPVVKHVDSDLQLTPVARPNNKPQKVPEITTTTQTLFSSQNNQVDNRGWGGTRNAYTYAWLSVLDYFNVDGGIVTGCFGDVKKFLKNRKLEKVFTVIKSCTPNALADLTVTVKDLSLTIYDTIHYKVLTERELPLSPTTGIFLVIKISSLMELTLVSVTYMEASFIPFSTSLLVNFSIPENHLTGSLPSKIGNQLPDLEWLQLASLSSAWFFGLKNTDRTESIDMIVNTSFMPSKRSPINIILAKGNVLPGMLKMGTLQKYDLKLDVTDLYLKGLRDTKAQ
nr:leucine-rich repeat protein [Tanacetum cinerariifolium]